MYYCDYGSISGKIEALSQANILYDDLWNRPIKCHLYGNSSLSFYPYFGKRVELYGEIKYNKAGKPTSIKVTDIVPYPSNGELPNISQVKGIFIT